MLRWKCGAGLQNLPGGWRSKQCQSPVVILIVPGNCPLTDDHAQAGQKMRQRSMESISPSGFEQTPRLRRMSVLANVVSLCTRTVEGTFRPAACQSAMARSYSETLGCDVIGAAKKSASPASNRTRAGRIFEPSACWNCIRINTTSADWSFGLELNG